MNLRFSFLSILSLLLLSCERERNGDSNENLLSCYANSNAQAILHNGIDREYVLYVPNSYDGSSTVPLMFNFHGFGGSASNFVFNADLRSLAELETFILVYPQGSCQDGAAHWNPCQPGAGNKSSADDLGFVELMITEISSRYAIDMERIYAAGYSNGGMMAYGLATHKSDLIAAAASVSGAMLDCSGLIHHPMPVLHLHGTSDAVIPYEGDSLYSSVQHFLDFWIDFNNTHSDPVITIDTTGGMTVEHYVYGSGDNGVSVEHYKYVGGGHEWFEARYQGQSTAELVWNFLSSYDLNGLR